MINVVLPMMIAGMLPFLFAGLAKSKGFSRADNHVTREWQNTLQGWRKRAYWAHQNAFETLPHFFAALLVASLARPHSAIVAAFAWGYVAMRVAYSLCYIADRASLRSVAWMLSMVAVVGLFVTALTA